MKDPIYKFFKNMDAERLREVKLHSKPPRRFRPSEADRCSRQIYYRHSGYRPTPDTVNLQLTRESGNVHHDYVRWLGLRMGLPIENVTSTDDDVQVAEEKTIQREFDVDGTTITISGRSDGDMRLPDKLAVLELKSMGYWYHKYLTKAFVDGGEAGVMARLHEKHRNYIWQGTTMALLNDRKWVYLLLVCRDNMAIGLYNEETGERTGGAVWEVDQKLQQEILQKFAMIERAVKAGEPPAPEYKDGSRECKQCPFRYACHGAINRKKHGIKPYVKYPVNLEETDER